MQALAGARLGEDAVQTLSYSLQEEYDWQDRKRTLRGYVARNTIEVRIDEVARVGEVLGLAVGTGVTSVSGFRFDTSKRAELEQEAEEDWNSSQGSEWTPRQHSASEEWQVVADLPGYLSLSGHLATYSGGAHGMYGMQSLVWDREVGAAMKGIDLFNSPVALEQALGNRLCDTLNTAREERRGMQIEEGSDDMFDKCPGLDEASVLVGSSNGKTFDRITVYFGPYVAGAYAEGDYELDFPVTASVVDAVKPAHAKAFSVSR